MDQALGEVQSSLTDLAVLVKLLGSEQEKMTERILQMHNTQGSTAPLEDQVKELRDLVGRSLSGPTSMQVASLEAKIRLLEAWLPYTLTGHLGGGNLSSQEQMSIFLWRSTSPPIHSTSSMML
jgi:cytochrome c-type biogenesis protein CcmH/NrfG